MALTISVDGTGVVRARSIACASHCRRTVPAGSLIKLTAIPAKHFLFAGWKAGCIGAAPACLVVADRDVSVRARFERKTDGLTLTVGGAATVTSDPTGIDCGAKRAHCSGDFPEGLPVTLTAHLSEPTDQAVWSNSCGTAPSCTVIAQPGLALTVSVHRPGAITDVGMRSLRVNPPLWARVTSDPPGIDCAYPGGARCTALFPWHSFVLLSGATSWSGACVGDTPRCPLFLDGDAEATVQPYTPGPQEARRRVSLLISVSPQSHGTVIGRDLRTGAHIRCGFRAASGCNPSFEPGSRVVLQGLPRASFGGWKGFCSGRGACKLMLRDTSKTVLAYFRH